MTWTILVCIHNYIIGISSLPWNVAVMLMPDVWLIPWPGVWRESAYNVLFTPCCLFCTRARMHTCMYCLTSFVINQPSCLQKIKSTQQLRHWADEPCVNDFDSVYTTVQCDFLCTCKSTLESTTQTLLTRHWFDLNNKHWLDDGRGDRNDAGLVILVFARMTLDVPAEKLSFFFKIDVNSTLDVHNDIICRLSRKIILSMYCRHWT